MERANRLLDQQATAIRTSLNFGWRGLDFKVERYRPDDQVDQLTIEAELGFLPFSAENTDSRVRAAAIIRNSFDPCGGRLFCLEHNGCVTFRQARREDGLSSLPEMMKRVCHRVIETSNKLDRLTALLVAA